MDGQIGRGDEATFRRRFTPRRPSSSWSERNVTLVDSLTAAGRMRPAGLRAVERARADGTWDAAYPGQAAAAVPDDLLAALAAEPDAQATFDSLNRANRYAVLYRIATATRRDTRARRIDDLVAMLARGEAFHPQKGLRGGHRGPGRRPRR